MSHTDGKGTDEARMDRRKKLIPVAVERRKANASEKRRTSDAAGRSTRRPASGTTATKKLPS